MNLSHSVSSTCSTVSDCVSPCFLTLLSILLWRLRWWHFIILSQYLKTGPDRQIRQTKDLKILITGAHDIYRNGLWNAQFLVLACPVFTFPFLPLSKWKMEMFGMNERALSFFGADDAAQRRPTERAPNWSDPSWQSLRTQTRGSAMHYWLLVAGRSGPEVHVWGYLILH